LDPSRSPAVAPGRLRLWLALGRIPFLRNRNALWFSYCRIFLSANRNPLRRNMRARAINVLQGARDENRLKPKKYVEAYSNRGVACGRHVVVRRCVRRGYRVIEPR